MTTLPPIGAVVSKLCSCGLPSRHRGDQTHPRYRVVDHRPNLWMYATSDDARLLYGDAILERLDTGRTHRTSMLVLRSQYMIVSLPAKAVLLTPTGDSQ